MVATGVAVKGGSVAAGAGWEEQAQSSAPRTIVAERMLVLSSLAGMRGKCLTWRTVALVLCFGAAYMKFLSRHVHTCRGRVRKGPRSEEHTSELQSLMRIS